VERNNTTAAGTVADMGNDGFNIPVLSNQYLGRDAPFSAECPSQSSGADKHAGALRHQGTADGYIAIAHSALFVNLPTRYAHVSQKKPEDYVHSSAQFYITISETFLK